jgi:hypothetical protein
MKPIALLLAVLCLASASSLVAQSCYSGPSFFSQRPDQTKSLTTIDPFGPVGMAIDLIQPAFTMRIKSMEEGSPADARACTSAPLPLPCFPPIPEPANLAAFSRTHLMAWIAHNSIRS